MHVTSSSQIVGRAELKSAGRASEIEDKSLYGKTLKVENEDIIDKGRQELERNFLTYFEEIRMKDKDKEVKFKQCIGDLLIAEN